jgi:hypothetical protein
MEIIFGRGHAEITDFDCVHFPKHDIVLTSVYFPSFRGIFRSWVEARRPTAAT